MEIQLDDIKVPSFIDYLEEESNVTTGVAVKDAPLGDTNRRKPLDEDDDPEKLDEDLDVPNIENGKGKSRGHMPQIIEFESFLTDLTHNRVKISLGQRETKELTPTQKNFNEGKVNAIIESGGAGLKPIIISKDGFVIDGHHRWLAADKLHRPIAVKEVDLTCEELLDFLRGKPYVERRSINEGKLDVDYLVRVMRATLNESISYTTSK